MNHDYAGDLVIVIDEIMNYAKASALYETQCRINEAKALMRRETLSADAAEMHVLTVNLAIARQKLALLKLQIESLPAEYHEPLSSLFEEAEQYIESLRCGRNDLVTRRRP